MEDGVSKTWGRVEPPSKLFCLRVDVRNASFSPDLLHFLEHLHCILSTSVLTFLPKCSTVAKRVEDGSLVLLLPHASRK